MIFSPKREKNTFTVRLTNYSHVPFKPYLFSRSLYNVNCSVGNGGSAYLGPPLPDFRSILVI